MHHPRPRIALMASVVALGVIALPAVADAAVTTSFDTTTHHLAVSSDGASDAVALALAAGQFTVNGTDAAPASADVVFDVDLGAGNDTLDASALAAADYTAINAVGGDGDDLLTGGAGSDTLDGAAGNDRVVGFKGNDALKGGAGNDVLVWNNGDGSDVADGDAGADEVEVNGAATAGDVFTIKPDVAPGRVRFDRTNLGPFNINASVEKFTINGLGGDDAVTGAAGLAALLPGGMAISGAAGNDAVTGGDTADLINGGDGDDTLAGAGGADRVVGDRGNDALDGGDGDDTLVWSNGDGTDSDTGGPGLDRTEVNGAGAGDAFTVVPSGTTRARFDRTNLGPFSLDVETEALDVRGLGGDDTLAIAAGLGGRIAVTADGGAGNDSLTGGDEIDTFFGGLGDDTLTGAGATDLLDGQDGNDTLHARDGAGDLVRGGAGVDSAQTDALGIDVVDSVEALDATPAPAPAPAGAPADIKAFAAKVTTSKVKLTRSRGRLVAKLKVSCPAAETGGCKATVSLATAKAIKIGGATVVAVLGSKSVSLRAGQTSSVSIKLASGADRLARKGKLAARATVATKDAAGNAATSTRTISLTVPKKRR